MRIVPAYSDYGPENTLNVLNITTILNVLNMPAHSERPLSALTYPPRKSPSQLARDGAGMAVLPQTEAG